MMQPLEKIKLACQIILKFKQRNTLTIDYPFEIKWLENADDETLIATYNEIMVPGYEPYEAETIDVPKSGGLIRHFSYLSLKDHLLYIILGFECFPAIYKSITGRSISDAVEALRNYPNEQRWLKKYIRDDKDMMEMRKPLYNKGYDCILTSDISAFAPNVDHNILCHALRKAGVAEPIVSKLQRCLNKWSPLGHKGVPQIYFTTDLLTEFYLLPIDRFFHSYGGLVYLRESDNIEIWCRSKASCKEMLALLARKMYEQGLYLNVYKTKMINERSIDRARHPMEHKRYGFRNSIKNRFSRFLKPYYHLNEFTKATNCSKHLTKKPENTAALLRHYAAMDIDITKSLHKFLTSGSAIYPYQNYAIIRWLNEHSKTENLLLFELIRQFAWNDNEPYYLRSAARHYIYRHGNNSDRDRLLRQCRNSNVKLERADLGTLLALKAEVTV